ncbi:phage portal protein [Devosia pacifica]|nr:phage portal protein [Devosia pacifica]
MTVTPARAMQVPAVTACVRAISEATGTLPVKVFRRLEGGGKEAAPDHPAYKLVHDSANPWTGAGKLREQLTQDALLYGHGVAWVNRVNGEVRELIRIDPQSVRVELNDRTSEPEFHVSDATAKRIYSWRDIVYIPAPALDGVHGQAPITTGREAIALALALQDTAARFFKNGAQPSGVVTVPEQLSPEAQKRLAQAWREAHGGENSRGTAVLEGGATWAPVTMTNVDSQFEQQRAAQNIEICRIFRVPPTFAQDYGRATWANSYSANLQFLQHCLMPWLRAWEDAFKRVLIPDDERDEYLVEFVTDALLKVDPTAKFEAYSKAIAARIFNPNEVRALENMPPYEGGDAFENPNTSSAPAAAPQT